MISLKTTTFIIRKIPIIFLLISSSFFSFGQGTVLAPGDIMILQIDEDEQGGSAADNFIFITFVDLVAGTTIYFTDCGVFPGSRTFIDLAAEPSYTTCPEGATRFVAASAIDAGSIFQFSGDSNPPGSPFSDFTDALITGPKIDFYTAGDQVIVFQDTDGTGGMDPSQNPTFIFILNADAGNFTFNPAPYYTTPSGGQQNDGSGTSVPTGLTANNSPAGSATAMAVGEGSAEIDNVIFDGTDVVPFRGATFAEKVLNAKIAIVKPRVPITGATDESNGQHWFGESNTSQGDADDILYFQYEAQLVNATNTLPVELTSFTGRPKVKTIDLLWKTASETNNDYFKVEKSTNGIDFKEMTKIDGRGTTTLETQYNWTDQSPNDGLNYYRLLQVDFDGSKSYSDIIVIEFEADRSEIQVFPNPTIKELNINLPENWDDKTSIVIYDFYGKMINSFSTSSGSLTFPVDNYPAGLYRLLAINKSKILNTSFVKK